MLINQLNCILLIISMTYAINFGQSESESSSDESNSLRVRSRRQFNKAEMDSCRDDCVASYLTMHQDIKFSVKEMIKQCKDYCESASAASSILEPVSQRQSIQQNYDYPLEAISSQRVDCEIKCLANKDEQNRSLSMKRRIQSCRQNCRHL